MRIKMKTLYCGPLGKIEKGSIVEVDKKTGNSWVKAGIACSAHKSSPVTGHLPEQATRSPDENAARGKAGVKDGDPHMISPAAAEFALSACLDIADIAGTGSGGSITVPDVKKAIAARDDKADEDDDGEDGSEEDADGSEDGEDGSEEDANAEDDE